MRLLSIPLKPDRTWMMLPSLLLVLFDALLTLVFQPPEYWSQTFRSGSENNPIGGLLIRSHPLAFIGGVLIWAFVIALIINGLPSPLERVVALAVLLGHTWGTSFWLYREFASAYWLRISVFIAIASITVTCWNQADKHKRARVNCESKK